MSQFFVLRAAFKLPHKAAPVEALLTITLNPVKGTRLLEGVEIPEEVTYKLVTILARSGGKNDIGDTGHFLVYTCLDDDTFVLFNDKDVTRISKETLYIFLRDHQQQIVRVYYQRQDYYDGGATLESRCIRFAPVNDIPEQLGMVTFAFADFKADNEIVRKSPRILGQVVHTTNDTYDF